MPKKKAHNTAIVPVAPAPIVKEDSPVQAILKRIDNVRVLHKFINDNLNAALKKRQKQLKPGEKLTDKERQELEIDYGTIPGVQKPFLKQPGAEKLLRWAYCRPVYETEVEKMGDTGHIEVVSRVKLLATADGTEVFSGPMCSCSSMESNFRFRWLTREPQPAKEEKERLKKLGAGRNRKEWSTRNGQRVEEWVWQDRIENPNLWDERNNVRQRSEKRALVKAVRQFGALSEIFTTDPNDWDLDDGEEPPVDHEPQGRVVMEPIDVKPEPPSEVPKSVIPHEQPPIDIKPQDAPVAPQQPSNDAAGVEIDWFDSQMPRIIGDSEVLRTVTKGHVVYTWKDEFWRCMALDVETIRCACAEIGLPFKEKFYHVEPPPKKTRASKQEAKQEVSSSSAKEPGETKSAGGGVAGEHSAAPTIIRGIVGTYKEKTTKKGNPFLSVLISSNDVIVNGKKEVWLTSFNLDVNNFIKAAKGKIGTFIVEHLAEQWPGLIGLKELAGTTYTDGKIPDVQRSSQQAGARTLF